MTPEARAEFLRRLPHAGFVPPVEGEAEPLDGIRALARDFWSLEPEERARRHAALLDATRPHGPARAWLRRMDAALTLRPSTPTGGGDSRFEQAVRELSVLPPLERAAYRRDWLARVVPEWKAWQSSAERFAHAQPSLAALAADLIAHLRRSPRDVVPTPADKKRADRPREIPLPAVAADSAERVGSKWSWWHIFVVVFVIRGCMAGGDMFKQSQRKPKTPVLNNPIFETPDSVERTKRLSQEIRERLQKLKSQPKPAETPP